LVFPLRVDVALRRIALNRSASIESDTTMNGRVAKRVDDAVRPPPKMDLMMRDGRSLKPNGNVIWESTGDGILAGIRFNVR
jgi:hypothetical protein